jgi:hypothetical protein
MTRRGSLAYYMSAVVFGSMFVSATFWLHHDLFPDAMPEPLASYFLWSYFRAAVVSFFPLLLDAFLLRRMAVYYRWTNAWVWVIAGSVIFVAVQWMLAAPLLTLAPGTEVSGWRAVFLDLLSGGPSLLVEKPFWLWPIPGLATAYVLFLVYRAFELPRGDERPAI